MTEQPLPKIILVAQNIRSLHNVGSLFRTADGFGVAKIFLTGYTDTPPRAEITKTALGAEASVAWEYQRTAGGVLRRLRAQGYRMVVLEITRTATPLPQYHPRYPLALIVGNEVRGITPAVRRAADDVVSIPMLGAKESFNVSVAAGIALYALRYPHR